MVLEIAEPSAVNSVIVEFSIEGFNILFIPGEPVVGNYKLADVFP